MGPNEARDLDVLIVGTGPSGAVTALSLAKYGIKVHMIAKTNWLAHTPRAHITNQRAMEVFRDLDIEKEVASHATPWHEMGDMLLTTSLAGEEIARIAAWGTGPERHGDYVLGSPCPLVDIIQPVIEPIILNNALKHGASVSFNTEYLGHTKDHGAYAVDLRDRKSGCTYQLRAKYLVGADGANSRVAQDIGLPMEGVVARAGTAYVIFEADLSKYVRHRPSTLHWIVNDKTSYGELGVGLLRNVRVWDQWIAGWGFDLSGGEPTFDDDFIADRIRTLVGDPKLDFEIKRKDVWYVNEQYATEYSRDGVFCAGDAVHRHPPSSGLGLNTCVQDAFNLGWKLAYVLKGYADQSLLASYSDERAPVGKQIVRRANQSRRDYEPLQKALRVAGSDTPVAAGIKRIKSSGQDGVEARKLLSEALALKQYEFNAQGVELNQRYTSSAIIADSPGEEEVWEKDPQLYLQATTRPGAKIPHVWLVDRNGYRVSTLDAVGKGKFSVVTGLSGQAWIEAAKKLNLPYLRTVMIGSVDFQDVWCDWQNIREIDEAGALLVRPDGYIAWRYSSPQDNVDEAALALSAALHKILGTDE